MTMPALFVSHGSPMTAIEVDDYNRALQAFAARIPRPRAIVAVSAHWEARGPFRVSTAARPETLHDFGGFPEALYRIRYPAPGDPALAERVIGLLSAGGLAVEADASRGLDHGVWTPLLYLYPAADIPVVAVSLPVPRTSAVLLKAGELLAPLRDEGVLVYGSGGLVHNLRRVSFHDKYAPVESWAKSFDDWVGGRIAALDVGAIARWPEQGASGELAVPTSEHFDPVFAVLGARRPGDRVVTLHEGFHHATLSMRCFSLEQPPASAAG